MMRQKVLISSLFWAALLSPAIEGAAVTQSEVAAHKQRMDDAEGLKYDIQDALQQKSTEKLETAATHLVELLKQEQGYWVQVDLPDISRSAKENTSAAIDIQHDGAIKNLDAAKAAFVNLNKTCAACHDQHPEGRVRIASH